MKVAIIGASGFIGSHLCDACVRKGDTVTALARSSDAVNELNHKGVCAFQGGLDDDALCRTIEGVDLVFNCAGALGKWRTPSDELERVNTQAAGQVVRCSAKTGARRVIHTSTAGVTGPLPGEVYADESYPCNPTTEYQRTKLAGEKAALEAHRETGIPLVIVRPAFVYGPGDTHKLSMFRAVKSGRIALVNRGSSELHPVYVDDLISGMLLAAERAPGSGETYILAGESPASTRILLDTVAAVMGVRTPVISLPEKPMLMMASMAEALGRAMGKEPPLTRSKVKLFSENYAYTIDRARREIGYQPVVDLREGIERTAEWYVEQNLIPPRGR